MSKSTTSKVDWSRSEFKQLREYVTDYCIRVLWKQEVAEERRSLLNAVNEQIDSIVEESNLTETDYAYQLLQEERSAYEAQLSDWISAAEIPWKVTSIKKIWRDTITYPCRTLRQNYAVSYKKCGGTGEIDGDFIASFIQSLSGMDISDTADLSILVKALSGRDCAKVKNVVTSDGKTFTGARPHIERVLMATLADIMIASNAIRPARIAPELKERYTRKAAQEKVAALSK